MLQLNITNEFSRLRAVVLGTANSNGPTPTLEQAYDPKSAAHIKAGTYPTNQDMILEMEGVAAVLEKYDVKVYRPSQIENYNQIFSNSILNRNWNLKIKHCCISIIQVLLVIHVLLIHLLNKHCHLAKNISVCNSR